MIATRVVREAARAQNSAYGFLNSKTHIRREAAGHNYGLSPLANNIYMKGLPTDAIMLNKPANEV
jgi:hypothetical protein